ncbi:MAG: phosphopantothenoylcysteine decarboxylase [Phycisphaerae bacterium]
MRRLRILVTAGPTREYFDTIRFISNPSSGKMGYAIATAAARRGHRVTLVSGPVELPAPRGVRVVRVVSAAEMLAAARAAFRTAEVLVYAAAVCDWRPARRARQKRAKAGGALSVRLVATPDIAATLGRVKGRRIAVGFALEDHSGRAHARQKMARKNFDLVLLNGPRNIGADVAEYELLDRAGRWQRWRASKRAIAARLIRRIESLAGTDA